MWIFDTYVVYNICNTLGYKGRDHTQEPGQFANSHVAKVQLRTYVLQKRNPICKGEL